jgi:thiamine biosynthesis lipoprotein
VNRIGVVTHVRPRMGTLLAISTVAGGLDVRARHLRAAFEIAARCERVMSRHDPDSDVSRLNRLAGAAGGLRAPELARVLRVARGLSRHLGGAFEPTIAPAIDLWRRAVRRDRLPSLRSITTTLAKIGARAVAIEGDRVSLPCRGTAIDLDGFGKGLALDCIAARLKRTRPRPTLLNFGESSLMAVGRPVAGPWAILLRNPSGGFAGRFHLVDRACATSSTLARPLRVGGRIVGDIIDPRTGTPVARRAQVTVIADSAAAAEAIATALIVLGRDAIDGIARGMGVEACWVDADGICATPRFGFRSIG